jgi:acetolactate synthase-1/2/3 large subunit
LSVGGPEIDSGAALARLADAIGAPIAPRAASALRAPDIVAGPLTSESMGVALARHMPEDCIVCDDSVTSGLSIFPPTTNAAPHDWLFHTGGAIGQGMPLAIGAAIGAPGRPVVALCGDGAAMYTMQSLWTMAREKLDITVVICANRIYRILIVELARTGAGTPGPAAQSLLSLEDPVTDWVKLAEAHGVPAVRCQRAEDFDREFPRLVARRGPKLIEAVL